MVPTLQVRRILGEGLYGQVLECSLTSDDSTTPTTPALVAVKRISLEMAATAQIVCDGARSTDDVVQEFNVARSIMEHGCHAIIAQQYQLVYRPNQMWLVSEFVLAVICTHTRHLESQRGLFHRQRHYS